MNSAQAGDGRAEWVVRCYRTHIRRNRSRRPGKPLSTGAPRRPAARICRLAVSRLPVSAGFRRPARVGRLRVGRLRVGRLRSSAGLVSRRLGVRRLGVRRLRVGRLRVGRLRVGRLGVSRLGGVCRGLTLGWGLALNRGRGADLAGSRGGEDPNRRRRVVDDDRGGRVVGLGGQRRDVDRPRGC